MTTEIDRADAPRLYPNTAEEAFMERAYLAFYTARDQYYADRALSAEQRFALITKMLSLYSESLLYESIRVYVEHMEDTRPPGEGTAYRYLEIIRHLLVHFNFSSTWNDVVFNRQLITWHSSPDSDCPSVLSRSLAGTAQRSPRCSRRATARRWSML